LAISNFNIPTQTTQFCKGRGDLQTSNQHELRFFGAARMSLGPVTPNVHIFKICQAAPKKNGASFRLLKRNQNGFLFWREPAHAKCAATDRFFQPKLKNSVVWAILFRVVFDFVQNAHEKNTCYFCNAMNLLILSVFMLDRQT
jgi:hypothetical protein